MFLFQWKNYVKCTLLILFLYFTEVYCNTENGTDIVVAKWEFHEFSIHIAVMIFLFIMILIKMAYHHIPYLSSYVPESLILIIIGIIFGAIVRYGIQKGPIEGTVWQLTPELFFNYLLPPIVLESAYSLYNRTFSEYLGVVLIFAVLGTVFNFLIIGFAMYGLFVAGAFGGPDIDFDVKGYLLYSSLIVAVDPVAVLAIFQDIGVELGLYYIVFGESLLNDAITVVLYDIMVAFTGKEVVTIQQIVLGIVSFFTVSFGGLFIGVLFGVLTCLITRIENHLNSFTLILLAYFSYIMADCVGWSGIISMIGCGLIQAAYAFHNLNRHSVTMVRNLTKIVSEMSESVIFLFLGIEVVSTNLAWHTGYMLWSLTLCLIARAVVVFAITAIVNFVQIDQTKISFPQQIVLIYGGLRGAVAFSLSVLIPSSKLGSNGEYLRQLIVTSTLFVILFTVGFMGVTMKPLVKLLKIRMQSKQPLSLFISLNENVLDECLAAVETLSGCKGRNVVRDFFMHLDENYLRRILQREPETYDQKMVRIYEKIALKLHYANMQPDKIEVYLKDVPDTLRYKYLTSQMSTFSLPGLLTSNLTAPHGVNNSFKDSNQAENYKQTKDVERGDSLHKLNSSAKLNTVAAPAIPNEVNDILRNIRRPSLAPNQKRQLDFDEAFMDVLKSRSRAIKQNLGIRDCRRLGISTGITNHGYDDEENQRKANKYNKDMMVMDDLNSISSTQDSNKQKLHAYEITNQASNSNNPYGTSQNKTHSDQNETNHKTEYERL